MVEKSFSFFEQKLVQIFIFKEFVFEYKSISFALHPPFVIEINVCTLNCIDIC